MIKKIFCITLLLNTTIDFAITPYYSIRSQSENAARELAGSGWNTQINLCDVETWNSIFAIIPEYTKSFRPYHISKCLFGRQCCFPSCSSCPRGCDPCYNDNLTSIRIAGSQVESRGPCDWLADYFGLPTDYISCISFEPYIENFLVSFNFYIGLDAWYKGLYFKIHAPIVHTRWDLDFCECMEKTVISGCGCIERECTVAHWPGYFSSTVTSTDVGIPCNNLVHNFESFVSGCNAINDPNIVFNPLCFARMSKTRLAKTGFAELQMVLGWNFLCNENYHIGLNIRAAAPTGNQPEAFYLFEPIVGNGKHWELGGGLSSHWTFWYSTDDEESLALYFDANVTHLFKTKQCRTFDLRCKPLSRYMLAAKYGSTATDLRAGDTFAQAEAPSHQFVGIYSPLANLTTFAVDVSVGIQADIALMLQYVRGNYSYDIGYNFWARSCDKIECRNDCCPYPFAATTWALKGDAFMYGFTPNVDATATAVPLSASQSDATLCSGTNNWPSGINGITWPQNPGIDNKKLAWDNNGSPLLIYDVTNTTTRQVYTSKDPIFIKFGDLDFDSARTKGLSHKIFMHFDYTWHNHEEWIPYIGIGGEVEFGHHNDDCCYPYGPCNTCDSCCGQEDSSCNPCCTSYYNTSCCCYCAVSQWGIWLKGGVAFH